MQIKQPLRVATRVAGDKPLVLSFHRHSHGSRVVWVSFALSESIPVHVNQSWLSRSKMLSSMIFVPAAAEDAVAVAVAVAAAAAAVY